MTNTLFPTANEVMPHGIWQRIRIFVTEKRIRISMLVIVLLVAEDVFEGLKPHDPFNFVDPWTVFGLSLIMFGLALRSWAAGVIRKRSALITTGPYSIIRNPLYFGSFSMMFGFCAIVNDAENIWCLLALILFIYVAQTRDEELCLAKKFSTAWSDYARATPRFIPRSLRTNLFTDWKLSIWRTNREYQTLLSTLLALVAIELWRKF